MRRRRAPPSAPQARSGRRPPPARGSSGTARTSRRSGGRSRPERYGRAALEGNGHAPRGSRHVDDLQPFDHLEVAPVVRAEREAVAEARCRDEQVEVADGQSLLTQPAALQPEAIADPLVEWEDGYTVEEAGEDLTTPGGIARVLDTLVQLGQRDDADGQTYRPELFKLAGDVLDTVEVIDGPVGVNQIRQAHNLTSGRVL